MAGKKKPRTEAIFCINCDMIDKNSVIVSKRKKKVKIGNKVIEGWVVELEVQEENERVPVDYTANRDRE